MANTPRITARDVRERFTNQAYYGGYVVGYEAAQLYHPDIVAVKRNLKLYEYEIKVDYADLCSELKVIEAVLAEDQARYSEPNPIVEGWEAYKAWRARMPMTNKFVKHRHYLHGHSEDPRSAVPNLYYFILPRDLWERTKDRFANLPYGVLDASTFYCHKKAKLLHKDTVSAYTMWLIAQNITGRLTTAA